MAGLLRKTGLCEYTVIMWPNFKPVLRCVGSRAFAGGLPGKQRHQLLAKRTHSTANSVTPTEGSNLSHDHLQDILQKYSTHRFYIEYQSFRSNHMPHGLTALANLGAERGRLEQFAQRYMGRLEEADGKTAKEQSGANESRDLPILGSRRDFYQLVDHYSDLLVSQHQGDLKSLLRSEFPRLAPGLAGAAFHGMIHTGHGFKAGSRRVTCEGLAYLHHSYLDLNAPQSDIDDSFGKGSRDILDVLNDMRSDDVMRRRMLSEASKVVGAKHYFDERIIALLKRVPQFLLQYTSQIKVPYLKDANTSLDDTRAVFRWLVDTAVMLYTISERENDFFILHAITAAWGLYEVQFALENHNAMLTAARTMLMGLLAVYLIQDSPALNMPLSADRLVYMDWGEITKVTLSRDLDEHIYKLISVVRTLADDCDNREMQLTYKEAANIALNHELKFLTDHPK